jgi:hypothetical protein
MSASAFCITSEEFAERLEKGQILTGEANRPHRVCIEARVLGVLEYLCQPPQKRRTVPLHPQKVRGGALAPFGLE